MTTRGSARRLLIGMVSAALCVAALVGPAGASGGHGEGSSNGNGNGNGRSGASDKGHGNARSAVDHVLLLSVDGLHQSDLAWYVQHHPSSALASLAARGVDYSNASTPFPSDSFPGTVGLVTGGDPGTTGVYYDDSWNRALLPAGTTDCHGAAPGAEVTYFEAADKNLGALDAGQGIVPAPGPDPWANILHLSPDPKALIDPKQLPVDPSTCLPVYPSQYLRVNTAFEVAHQHHLTTAWSDKHPAYQILAGPSGSGVDDFFTPEINSSADTSAPTDPNQDDWTTDNLRTQAYDGYKVHAVVNWIDGHFHDGGGSPGTPAIFGMNFQSVSTAQKLPTSDTEGDHSGTASGGYLADGATPGPVLANALDFVDASLGAMVGELDHRGLAGRTAIIVTAKHGQSPMNPAALNRIDDGKIVDALNAAWNRDAQHGDPGAPALVAFSIDDDGMLIWLNDRSPAAVAYAKNFLANDNDASASIDAKPVTSAGLSQIYAGSQAAQMFATPLSDARMPDIVGLAQYGVVYTGKKHKIAEHGGDHLEDRNVPILIAAPGVAGGTNVTAPVETTQVAPTILQLLGLDPQQLQAVKAEGTRPLL